MKAWMIACMLFARKPDPADQPLHPTGRDFPADSRTGASVEASSLHPRSVLRGSGVADTTTQAALNLW